MNVERVRVQKYKTSIEKEYKVSSRKNLMVKKKPMLLFAHEFYQNTALYEAEIIEEKRRELSIQCVYTVTKHKQKKKSKASSKKI